MARAMKTFRIAWAGSGVEVLPATTDVQVLPLGNRLGAAFPHASSLSLTTQFVKEYAALIGLYMIAL
jgi:hypothetical protein